MEQITENVFVETAWRGANSGFVVTSEGIVLIDVPPDIDKAQEWAKEIAKKGEIRYIINTELHHDHWITNSVFDGVGVTHQITREMMLIMDHEFIRGRTSRLYADPLHLPDDFELQLPAITFTEHMTIHLGGHTFQLIHTPGHSAGQIAVYIPEEKVVFPGDSVLNQIKTPYHDAITDNRWLESMKVLEELDVRFIVPGHGEVLSGKEYLKTQTSVVSGFLKAVQEGKTDGVRLSEELNRSIDPFYDNPVIGRDPERFVLTSSMYAKESGKHGDMLG
ncbi:MBL fold metallo-hydrolase [Chloroflexota bacterium]